MKWLKCLVVALVYFLLAKISFLTTLPSQPATGPALAWLPTGFAVAAILLEGYWIWPGIAFGSLLQAIPLTSSFPVISGFVLANTVDPLLAVWLPRRILKREFDLSCSHDATVFILVVTLVSSVFSAIVGSLTLMLSATSAGGTFLKTFFIWWVSDFLSILVIAPLLIAWMRKYKGSRGFAGKAEIVFGVAIGVAMVAFIFSMPFGYDTSHFVYWLIPFVIWLSFRVGIRGVTTGIFLLAVVTIIATSLGKGPFLEKSVEESFIYVQSFLTVISILGILLVAAAGERNKAIQDRDDFFLLASHELNTPLTVLGMQSFFLKDLMDKDQLESLPVAQRREMVRINNREIKKLSDIVTDLLMGARIVSGKLGIEREATDMRELVSAIVQEITAYPGTSGVEIHTKGDSAIGNWDRAKISFVVKTLLLNAIKYGAGNPINISIESANRFALLAVEDNGIGISQELQLSIFERFGHLGQLRFFGGLGQGLFISRAIVKAHGGDISVVSSLGRGTIFSVKLPV